MISNKTERMFDSPKGGSLAATGENRATRDERLNHILEAATMEIARVGYEKASMRMVAKASGVSLAGLYHYFHSKEKMLFLIQFRTFAALLNNLREKLHGVNDPVEQLRVMVRAHVGYFADHMAALKTCSHELDSLSGQAYDETRAIRKEYYDLSRSIIERILDAHSPGSTFDRHVVTMSLLGTLNWLYCWYDPKRDRSPTTIAIRLPRNSSRGLSARHEPESKRTIVARFAL